VPHLLLGASQRHRISLPTLLYVQKLQRAVRVNIEPLPGVQGNRD
jgi:hypothetical protein